MSTKRQTSRAGAAARVIGLLGICVLPGLAQQKSPVGSSSSTSQYNASQAQQQAQMLAQAGSPQSAGRPGQSSSPFSGNQAEEPSLHLQEQARLKGNDQRQKKLESDARRLLALANLLKTEVAASGSETMTPEMLRQMDEIEKLARSVKDRMRS